MTDIGTMGDAWDVLDRHDVPRSCEGPHEHCLPTARALMAQEKKNKILTFALNDLIQAVTAGEMNKTTTEAVLQANNLLNGG